MKKLKTIYLITVCATFVFSNLFSQTPKSPVKSTNKLSVYDFKLKTIDGKEITLAEFKGKKMLLVNVASKCGYTPQYEALQRLSERYKEKLVVIGFPANNFGSQEPGTNNEIKEFCKANYGVTFLMMSKISVKGTDMHPLYRWLSTKEENGLCNEAPDWNFCKYLIDENGAVMNFFKSDVDPNSSEITGRL